MGTLDPLETQLAQALLHAIHLRDQLPDLD